MRIVKSIIAGRSTDVGETPGQNFPQVSIPLESLGCSSIVTKAIVECRAFLLRSLAILKLQRRDPNADGKQIFKRRPAIEGKPRASLAVTPVSKLSTGDYILTLKRHANR
jgi:hypothetical protein